MLDFTAIDFETANQRRESPCSLGIAKVRDGRIVDFSTRLIRPHRDHFRFSGFNVAIHGIDEFAHHDAEEDARTSALILIAACRKLGADSIADLSRMTGLSIGHLKGEEYVPCAVSPSRRIPVSMKPPKRPAPSTDHPLRGKEVVFTGVLRSMSREQAFDLVSAAGGNAKNYLTTGAEYLVLGIQCHTLFRNGGKSGKIIRAEQFRGRGYPIEIISEDEFLKLLYPEKE